MSRSDSAGELPTLPDLLTPGLDLVFVGINPGERSAERGHYYGHPGNTFWCCLSRSPLASRELTPEDDAALMQDGIGFTDLVKRVITDSSLVSDDELREAIPAFRARLAPATTRAVCFTAVRPFATLYPGAWRARGWGRQDVPPLEGAQVWVMPSPSGRAAAYHREIDTVLAALAADLGQTNARRGAA